MKYKKWLSLLLCLALVFGFSGCLGNAYEYAGTINGQDITSGLYLMAQNTAISEAKNKVEDSEKDLFKQKVEGVSANSWIKARTEELLRRYVCIRALCREKGISLDSTGQQNVEQTMQYWAYLEQMYMENGISQSSFERFITTDEMGRQLFAALYAEGGELAVPDSELKAEYGEKYAHVRMLSIPTSASADGLDVRDKVTEMAREMVKKLEGGKTLEEVAVEDVAEVYEVLMRDFDPDTAVSGIFDNYIEYDQEESETYSREELDLLKTQPVGSFGLIVTTSTVILYEKVALFADNQAYLDRRDTVVSQLKSEAFEDYLKGIYSTYEVHWKFGARWYMRPKKMV